MAKLTMNTPGSGSPRLAEFQPQPQPQVSKLVLVGGGAVFLAMFSGLVVTTTLLVTRDRTPEVTFSENATALEEPSLVDLTNAVARQEVSEASAGRTRRSAGAGRCPSPPSAGPDRSRFGHPHSIAAWRRASLPGAQLRRLP